MNKLDNNPKKSIFGYKREPYVSPHNAKPDAIPSEIQVVEAEIINVDVPNAVHIGSPVVITDYNVVEDDAPDVISAPVPAPLSAADEYAFGHDQIAEGSVIISTASCNIICRPKETIDTKSNFIFVLDQSCESSFSLNKNIAVKIRMQGTAGNIVTETVAYRGLVFPYNGVKFMVFDKK